MITEAAAGAEVRHTLRPNMLWVLPHEILTFKAIKCKDCRRKDDARHSLHLRAPRVWACKDIERGAELLVCRKNSRGRGAGCAAPVGADDAAAWYVV